MIAKVRLDATNDLAKVKDWINQIYAEAAVETEATVTSMTMTMTANVSSYTISSSIARIKSMYVTPVVGTQTSALRLTTLDRILAWRQGASGPLISNGTVQYYALLGSTEMEVYPTPASADVLTIYYVSYPTSLSGNTDVPSAIDEPYATRVIEYGAASEAADWKGDPSEQEYRQLYEIEKTKLRAHLTRKMGGQPGQFNIFPSRSMPPHDPSTDIGL